MLNQKYFYVMSGVVVTFIGIGLVLSIMSSAFADDIYIPFVSPSANSVSSATLNVQVQGTQPIDSYPPPSQDMQLIYPLKEKEEEQLDVELSEFIRRMNANIEEDKAKDIERDLKLHAELADGTSTDPNITTVGGKVTAGKTISKGFGPAIGHLPPNVYSRGVIAAQSCMQGFECIKLPAH